MGDPQAGKGGTYYVPFPVLALASNGGDIFLAAGGGGSTANKEVPNVVHAHRFDEATGKLNTIAALNTEKALVVSLTYSPTTDLWLASSRTGCKVLSLNVAENTLTQLCEWASEEAGKEPEQNIAKFSPDGKLIVTGGTDGQVKLWKADALPAAPSLLRLCGSKTKEILDADFSADSKYLAVCDDTGDCRLWEVAKEEPEDGQKLQYQSKHVKGKAFIKLVRFLPTADGKWTLVMCASGGRGPAVVGLFAQDGTKLSEVMADKQPLKSIAVDIERDRCLVGLMSGAKAVYSLPKLSLLKKTKEVHSLPAQRVAWVGETAISGSGDRDFHLLKVGGSARSALCYVLIFFLMFAIMSLMVLRIGTKGAALGQGKSDL
eukprot:CAMPEP_0176054136 /NCGR_PEP_ID=MMETSP0120_2-20121206/26933_1 /TAXON_ID=160619 /ORGANISM="Kryptoperidinium foliaceum, Strain CCMP 1326" /LENGTH=374 /DNA_ID=CAMNT_0017387599 /DNA_START=31 /DNA_END=1155 /DNA_ORIENTATION=+